MTQIFLLWQNIFPTGDVNFSNSAMPKKYIHNQYYRKNILVKGQKCSDHRKRDSFFWKNNDELWKLLPQMGKCFARIKKYFRLKGIFKRTERFSKNVEKLSLSPNSPTNKERGKTKKKMTLSDWKKIFLRAKSAALEC